MSADFSVSDAWLPKYIQKNDDGWNLILTMTEKAEKLMTSERIKDCLHIEEEIIDNFYQANSRVIDKADVGNMMRMKENRIEGLGTSLTIKKRMYVIALKVALKIFKPNRMNSVILIIGKIINKLKE